MRTPIITLFIIVTPLVFISACSSSPEDIVRNNTEEELFQSLHDPDSYEFAGLVLVHAYTHRENIEYRISIFEDWIEYRKHRIESSKERINSANRSLSQPHAYVDHHERIISREEENISNYEQEIENYERIIDGLVSLKASLGSSLNDEIAYRYAINFRANNAMGALVLQEYFVQTDTDFNILNIAEDEGKLMITPNMLSEYHEIVNQ